MSEPHATAFDGFSVPDGAYLPPELIYLLPSLDGAEIKVLLVVLYCALGLDRNDAVSLTDVQRLSGMSRSTVSETIKGLLRRGLMRRDRVGQSYSYQLTRKLDRFEAASTKKLLVGKSNHKLRELRESDSLTNNSLTDSLNSNSVTENPTSELDERTLRVLHEMRACGVYLATAQSLIQGFGLTKCEAAIAYYRYALRRGIARTPGWLALCVKEDWGAPPGYEDENKTYALPAWYAPADDGGSGADLSDLDEPDEPDEDDEPELFRKAVTYLRSQMGSMLFEKLLSGVRCIAYDGETMELMAPSQNAVDLFDSRVRTTMERLMPGLAGKSITITIKAEE